jgi:hypothetical protein
MYYTCNSLSSFYFQIWLRLTLKSIIFNFDKGMHFFSTKEKIEDIFSKDDAL